MSQPQLTLLFDVEFFTWTKPDPSRLGTSERAIGKIRLWAKNGDEAIEGAKQILSAQNIEWLNLLTVDVVQGVYLEQILNDPLNPHAIVALKNPVRLPNSNL